MRLTKDADDVIKSSFARSDDSESYNSMSCFDEKAFAIPRALALSDDVYDDLCSVFITLGNDSSENHCNNLLHVLWRYCDVISEFIKKISVYQNRSGTHTKLDI